MVYTAAWKDNGMNIAEIKDGVKFEGVALVRGAEVRTTKAGKPYLELGLADKSGAIQAKCWDPPQTTPEAGALVAVAGKGGEYNGRPQLTVDHLGPAPADAAIEDFVPCAPRDPQAMLNEVLLAAAALRDASIRAIVCELIKEANRDGRLLTFPAAKQLHHAERGGLLHHLTDMLRLAKALVDIHPWLDGDLLCAGVIVHDLGKLAEMQSDAAGLAADYTVEGRLIGHIVRGAIDIARVAERVGADPEKTVLLQHLVLSHHGKLEFGSPVLPKIPEAEALSVIDVLDARLFEMRDALAGVEPGGFSAKVWCLDNRELYRTRPPAPPASVES